MRQLDILLATYNGATYLSELLASLVAQDFVDWYLIIRDDGSTDCTLEIIRSFCVDHPDRVQVLDDDLGNLGVVANFERLLQVSKADYVMFADQDDVWLTDKISLTFSKMRAIEKENHGLTPCLVFTDMVVSDKYNKVLCQSHWRYANLQPGFAIEMKNSVTQNVVTGCTIMINRCLVSKLKIFPSDVIMHDWWLGIFASAFGRVGFLETSTIRYRQHELNNVGAACWNWIYVIRAMFASKVVYKHRILKTQQQASAFLRQYGAELSSDQQAFLEGYSSLANKGWFRRKMGAFSLRILRTNFLRSVAFYLLV